MEAKQSERSETVLAPLSGRAEGLDQTERCLNALDQKGEEGLQAELERIYGPRTTREMKTASGATVRCAWEPPSRPLHPRTRQLRRRRRCVHAGCAETVLCELLPPHLRTPGGGCQVRK